MPRGINAQATLYNTYKNPLTKTTQFRPVILEAVHWENNKGASVNATGIIEDSAASFMVWFDVKAQGRIYVSPKAYARLNPEEVDGCWTITEGSDRVIKGVVPNAEVTENLSLIMAMYDDGFGIMSVDTRDMGPKHLWHWDVALGGRRQ